VKSESLTYLALLYERIMTTASHIFFKLTITNFWDILAASSSAPSGRTDADVGSSREMQMHKPLDLNFAVQGIGAFGGLRQLQTKSIVEAERLVGTQLHACLGRDALDEICTDRRAQQARSSWPKG
jgi:hypothetical protein